MVEEDLNIFNNRLARLIYHSPYQACDVYLCLLSYSSKLVQRKVHKANRLYPAVFLERLLRAYEEERT